MIHHLLRALRKRLRERLAPYPGDRPGLLFRGGLLLWRGLQMLAGRPNGQAAASDTHFDYQQWIAANESPGGDVSCLDDWPTISVVMPVYRPNLAHLREAIASVAAQTYAHWQLCLCDDGTRDRRVTEALNDAAAADPRIRVKRLPANQGIAAATNAAIEMSTGEYIALLDQDDRLAPHALASVAAHAAETNADVLYSDWDRLDAQGRRAEPFFKPDWSPELLRGMMVVAHLTVYRRAFLDEVGLFRSAFDGAQDWELALRATAQTDRIVHIPGVLYHWRLGGVSSGKGFNRVCHERGRLALFETLLREGDVAVAIEDGFAPCTFHLRRPPPRWPRVSILIPSRDNLEMLRRCVDSVRRRTNYPDYEIVLIDNGSRRPDMQRWLDRCAARVLHVDEPFNHARLNNLAAAQATGELLVLLNDDTEVISRDWLRAMAEQALRTDVGAVGGWLFHADGRTQHAGIALGYGPVASPINAALLRGGLDRGTIRLIREVSAVTGACLMIRKQLYMEIGGLDEQALPTSFNDVDLCLRLRQAGYRNLVTPLARLYHHEGATRTIGDESWYIALMHERWGEGLKRDPYWTVPAPAADGVIVPILCFPDNQPIEAAA